MSGEKIALKKCCIVHIGMNKTGSSSIQKALGLGIVDKNFSYVSLPSHNHSGRIVSLFMEAPETYHTHRKRDFSRKQISAFNAVTHQHLIQHFRDSPAETHIISGEGISKLSEFELRKLKKFLTLYFKQITIVAYYRLPSAFMESAFQQRVKGGLNRFNIKNMYPNYQNLFEKFDKVFSRENVSLWRFEPKEFVNGDVVLDFCNRLKIDTTKMEIIRENEALSLESISFLYCYHKFGEGYGVGKKVIKENELLVTALNTLGNTKFTLSHKLIELILDDRKEDLSWMEERTGGVLYEKEPNAETEISQESELISIALDNQKELSKLLIQHDVVKKFNEVSPHVIAQQIQTLRIALSKKYYKEVL